MTETQFKRWKLLIVSFLLGTMSFAQSIAPQSLNNSGANVSNTIASLSYTVGELVVLSQKDSNGNMLSSGFTSGATLSILSLTKTDFSIKNVRVFPNPTEDLFYIQIDHSVIHQIRVKVNDFQGKELFNGVYPGISNTITLSTSGYATGTYILSLSNQNDELLGMYKIFKQ